MMNVEKRLAALKSSTQINGFQRPLLRRYFSEANASGMVSSSPIPFLRLATPHFSWSPGMYGFSFQRMMDALIYGGGSFHHGLSSIHLNAIRTERAFLKSERRNIFVESRDFRNAR
jgi:hypothetical protein